MNNSLYDYLSKNKTKEKTRFTVIDKCGVEFHVGNVICEGKVYFVVSANGKVIECLEVSE